MAKQENEASKEANTEARSGKVGRFLVLAGAVSTGFTAALTAVGGVVNIFRGQYAAAAASLTGSAISGLISVATWRVGKDAQTLSKQAKRDASTQPTQETESRGVPHRQREQQPHGKSEMQPDERELRTDHAQRVRAGQADREKASSHAL